MGSTSIGRMVYPSKKAAAQALRDVLWRYKVGATVCGADEGLLRDLLDMHPEREQKVGCGVRSFQVEWAPPNRCFWLTRTDGTRTDFSFLACLTPPTPAKKAAAAFRFEIRGQILDFRDAVTDWRCPITGDTMTPDTVHIDHDPPFASLLADFLRALCVDLDAVAVMPTEDGATGTRIADRKLAASWCLYHMAHARLRAVSAKANLGVLRRKGGRDA